MRRSKTQTTTTTNRIHSVSYYWCPLSPQGGGPCEYLIKKDSGMAHPPGIYLGSQASPSESKECDIIWPHSELIIIPVSWNVNNSMKHSVSHLIKGSIRKVSVGSGCRLIDRVLALDAWGPKFDPQHRKKDDKEGRDRETSSVLSNFNNYKSPPNT